MNRKRNREREGEKRERERGEKLRMMGDELVGHHGEDSFWITVFKSYFLFPWSALFMAYPVSDPKHRTDNSTNNEAHLRVCL